MRALLLSSAALGLGACALALSSCGDTLQDRPVPHNSLESMIVAPYPVYWLGRSFEGLRITEATHDPSGAFTVQYGDCITGGQYTCVPPLRVVTSYLPPPPPASGPGPFSLADPGLLEQLLARVGFARPRVAPLALPYLAGATPEDAARLLLQLGPAAAILREAGKAADPFREKVEADLREALAPFSGARGVELPAMALIATASA